MMEIFKKTIKDPVLRKLRKIKTGSLVVLSQPSKEELEAISEELRLNMATLEDALDENELPRIETEKDATYIIINIPYEEAIAGHKSIITLPLLIILTEKNIITVSKKDFRIIKELIAEKDSYTTQKIKLLLKIFSRAGKSYEKFLNRLTKEVKSKKHNLKKLSDDDIIRLVEIEETLNDFISSYLPTVRVLNKLIDGKTLRLYKDDRELIEDLIIDSQQTLDLCKTTVKTTGNIREAYSTVMSNSLNKTMKFLTVMTILLTVPTIISSIYGMNIRLPLQKNIHAFSIVLGFTAATVVVLFAIMKLRKWI